MRGKIVRSGMGRLDLLKVAAKELLRPRAGGLAIIEEVNEPPTVSENGDGPYRSGVHDDLEEIEVIGTTNQTRSIPSWIDKDAAIIALKYTVILTVLGAIFWGVWYLVAGSVPVTTHYPTMHGIIRELPFAISRWWDIPALLIFTPIISYVVHGTELQRWIEEKVDEVLPFFSLIFGVTALIVSMVPVSLIVAIPIGLLVFAIFPAIALSFVCLRRWIYG